MSSRPFPSTEKTITRKKYDTRNNSIWGGVVSSSFLSSSAFSGRLTEQSRWGKRKKKPGGKSSGKKCIPRHESHHKYMPQPPTFKVAYLTMLAAKNIVRWHWNHTTRCDTKYKMLNWKERQMISLSLSVLASVCGIQWYKKSKVTLHIKVHKTSWVSRRPTRLRQRATLHKFFHAT